MLGQLAHNSFLSVGVCLQDSAELKDTLAEVGHQWKELYSTMSVISLGDVMTECLSIYDIHVYYPVFILEGQTTLLKRHLKSINAFMWMCQCLVLPQSFSLSFSCTSLSLPSLIVCLSLTLSWYHSLSILFAVWGHYVYSITERYQVCVTFPSMLTAV